MSMVKNLHIWNRYNDKKCKVFFCYQNLNFNLIFHCTNCPSDWSVHLLIDWSLSLSSVPITSNLLTSPIFKGQFNSVWPGNDTWHPLTWLSLVRVMAQNLCGAKPLPKLLLTYCKKDQKVQTSQWIVYQTTMNWENSFENFVCKLSAILFRLQLVTSYGISSGYNQG